MDLILLKQCLNRFPQYLLTFPSNRLASLHLNQPHKPIKHHRSQIRSKLALLSNGPYNIRPILIDKDALLNP